MVELGFGAARTARALTACMMVLVLISISVECAAAWWPDVYGMTGALRLFRLRGEDNLGTVFSGALLAMSAALLAIVSGVERARGAPDVIYWRLLALGFLYLCLDELLALHERLNGPMRALLGEDRPGILNFAWVLPAGLAVLTVGASFVGFWLRLERWMRLRTAVAAAVFLGGAIGMEMMGGVIASVDGAEWTYVAIVTIEETMEMAGVIIFIESLLRLLASRSPIVLRAGTGPAPLR